MRVRLCIGPNAFGNALGSSLAAAANGSARRAQIEVDQQRSGYEEAAYEKTAWAARNQIPQVGASAGVDGDDPDLSFGMPGEKEFEWGGGKPGYGMSTGSRPISRKDWPTVAAGGKLTPNPDGADYPSGYLEDGVRYTKHLYSDAQVGTIPVIQTPDNRVYAFPGGTPGTELPTVTIPGMSLPDRLQAFTDEHIAQTNAQMERNLTALTQEMLALEIRIDPVQATASYVLGLPGTNTYLAEAIGVQSLPGTIDATKDILLAGAAAYSARHTRVSFVSAQPNGTGAIITTNNRPTNGGARVSVSYGVPRPPSALAQFGLGTAGMLKRTPGLSVGGTMMEYGAYHLAGKQKNEYGDSLYSFASDASLDLGKAVVSGGVGVGASIATSALLGAVGGSAVPVLGTAVGFGVGLLAGIWAAATIEEKIIAPSGAREDFTKYLEGRFK